MKLRVFEAFAGYGSQSIALKLVAKMFPGFEFESVGISEIDKYAIKAYRALHGEAIPNLGDITKINWGGYDADIDLFTYSFPCQDISSAGKQRGLSEGSGTRSSCLWACADAIEAKHPKFLLMENVKALAVQKKFADDFAKWRKWLRKQGYTNYYAVLNSKDYGVPQNRERVFMVSLLGSHAPFYFPAPFPLERRLKHILEDEVEEKYWLKPANIQSILRHNERKQAEGCGFKTNFQTGEGISGAIKTKEGSREYDTYIKVPTYGNSRLNEMIADGKINPEETMWIDCYNQRVDPDIAGTILARVNATAITLCLSLALSKCATLSGSPTIRTLIGAASIPLRTYRPASTATRAVSARLRYCRWAAVSTRAVCMTSRLRSPHRSGRTITLPSWSIGYANSLRASASD